MRKKKCMLHGIIRDEADMKQWLAIVATCAARG
jgi:hypothetical protein